MPHGGAELFIQNPHGGSTAPKMIPTPKWSPTLKWSPNRPRNDSHFSSRRPGNDPQLILGMGWYSVTELLQVCCSVYVLESHFTFHYTIPPYNVILCKFWSLFYFIYISVNSWYLNKPDEDWYWPVEISQLNSISRCLISPCKSLLDCNAFNALDVEF